MMCAPFGSTVLVVEDEALVRMDLVDQLIAAGHQAFEASCAADAISILEMNTSIRVVFTDVQMPGDMDGLALSHYVRKRWPPTIIVVCSGNKVPTEADLPTGATFIPKPYDPDSLSRVMVHIKQLLTA